MSLKETVSGGNGTRISKLCLNVLCIIDLKDENTKKKITIRYLSDYDIQAQFKGVEAVVDLLFILVVYSPAAGGTAVLSPLSAGAGAVSHEQTTAPHVVLLVLNEAAAGADYASKTQANLQ